VIVVIIYIFKLLTELLLYSTAVTRNSNYSCKRPNKRQKHCQSGRRTEDNDFDKLLSVSRAAAVVGIRRELEASLMTYAERRGMTRIPLGWSRLSRELRKQDLIDNTTFEVLGNLISTANAAAHSSSQIISETDARRFRDVAERVMRGLDVLGAAAKVPVAVDAKV
jgi:Mn-dependent DtxR family transcriptional regulator